MRFDATPPRTTETGWDGPTSRSGRTWLTPLLRRGLFFGIQSGWKHDMVRPGGLGLLKAGDVEVPAHQLLCSRKPLLIGFDSPDMNAVKRHLGVQPEGQPGIIAVVPGDVR